MTELTLTKLILELYQKLHHVEPDSRFLKVIQQIVDSNGLGSPEKVPSWFLDFWKSIINGKTVNRAYFPTGDILRSDGDIINFFAELADVIEMNYENYGEGITMKFETLNIDVFICLEGGQGTCFYQIRLLNHYTKINVGS